MENLNKTEYDGSTPTRVFINKLSSVSSVDKATDRIKIRFDFQLKKRKEIIDQFSSINDPELRGNLVDDDEKIAVELTKLLKAKKQLGVKRQELIDARAIEVQDYQQKEISW